MSSEYSIYRVVVDRWEDYSEKSFKVWKGNATAYFAKSLFEIGDMPNEFLCDRGFAMKIADRLIEASEQKKAA